eukprot:TRINITY_DN5785_c0_g1_i1.p1 TRINITY_DN5785_c0_g1~~TRINITY_DN5785_c0_g1_i1.p1  ORF type:complete len:348 (+),score=47.08 TRINITY_DN5785_c0_g1_i1:82-1125(+)
MMGLGSGISAIGNRIGDWYNGNPKKRAPSVTTTPVRTTLQHFPPCVFCDDPLHPSRNPLLLSCKHPTCQSCAQKNVYGEVIKCPKCNEPTILDETKGTDHLDSLQLEENLPNAPDFVDVPLNLKVSVEDMPFVDDAPVYQDECDYTDATEEDFVVVGRAPVIIPDYYIPFTQRKESCKPLISHWLTNIWFPPSDLNEKKEIVDPHPHYVPFYVFSVKTQTHWRAEVGTTNGKKEVQWNALEGNFSSLYEQLAVCASSEFHPRLVDMLLNGQKGFSMNTDKVIPSEPLRYKPNANHQGEETVLSTDLNHYCFPTDLVQHRSSLKPPQTLQLPFDRDSGMSFSRFSRPY